MLDKRAFSDLIKRDRRDRVAAELREQQFHRLLERNLEELHQRHHQQLQVLASIERDIANLEQQLRGDPQQSSL